MKLNKAQIRRLLLALLVIIFAAALFIAIKAALKNPSEKTAQETKVKASAKSPTEYETSGKNEKVNITPNLTKLNKAATKTILAYYREYKKEQPYVQDKESYELQKIEINRVERVPEMLSDPDTYEEIETYLVYALVTLADWKNDVYLILLFKETGNDYVNLLTFGGGQNGNGVDYEIVDLNEKDDQKEILISDFQAGNQMSQARAYIYKYDSSQDKFVEIFNELISWLPMFTPCVYSSKIDFRRGKKDFKDILIETDLTLYKNSDNKETGSAERKSIYRWNGKRYVGKFNVPDCGRNDWESP